MAMKYRTQYNRVQIKSNSGDRFAKDYKLTYTETGSETLQECGVVDVYADIQSYKDSCDLKTIIERFNAGDTQALNRKPGFFADVVDVPTSLAGWLNLRSDADKYFYQLPVEVRAEFNQNSNEFFAQIGTERFNSIMAKFNQPTVDFKESEVKESDEQKPE